MLRNIAAVIAGLVVGSAVNMALIMLNMFVLFPAPAGLDMADPVAMNAYIAGLPTAAFLVVLAAHLGQAFVGGCVAARLGGSRPVRLAMIVGIASLVGGVMNMMTIRGPDWMFIELPLYPLVALLAGRAVEAGRARG